MIHITLRTALPAALFATLASVGTAGGELSAEKSSGIHALFTQVMGAPECTPTGEHECAAPCKEAWDASEQLGSMLVKKPVTWTVSEPLVYAEFETHESNRGRVIDFLVHCGSEDCVTAGEKLYKETPASFTEMQMLAFAERASDAFANELAARVKESNCETVMPAAYLAIHGNDAGVVALKQAAHVAQIDETNVVDALVASAALERLGVDDVRAGTLRRIHETVLAALDAGQFERAREIALRAEAVNKAFAGKGGQYGKKKKVSLSYLDNMLGWHVRERSKEIATADDVFTLIETIAPAS